MTPRLRNAHLLAPEGVQAMMALEASFDSVNAQKWCCGIW